jgi:hypothetical protein
MSGHSQVPDNVEQLASHDTARQAGEDRCQDRGPRPFRGLPNWLRWRCRERCSRASWAGSTDSGRGRSSHDRVALDTGIGTGEVCPQSAGKRPRRLGRHIAAAETQPGGLAPLFHAAMTCGQCHCGHRHLGNPSQYQIAAARRVIGLGPRTPSGGLPQCDEPTHDRRPGAGRRGIPDEGSWPKNLQTCSSSTCAASTPARRVSRTRCGICRPACRRSSDARRPDASPRRDRDHQVPARPHRAPTRPRRCAGTMVQWRAPQPAVEWIWTPPGRPDEDGFPRT